MVFQRYGKTGGSLAFYFHGVPGAATEAALFDDVATTHSIELVGVDRFVIDTTLNERAYFQRMAELLDQYAAGRPFALVGFSLGAFVALQTCRFLPRPADGLYLISAAAPLQAGPFLDQMAGKQVFRLARSSPLAFSLLSRWQALLARVAPTSLFNLLFASASGADRALITDATFRQHMLEVLGICFRRGLAGYLRDIQLYIQPWQHTLADIAVPTRLWHGAADNWSPPAMASYLQSAIKADVALSSLPELSHYSCLYAAVPEICRMLSKPER